MFLKKAIKGVAAAILAGGMIQGAAHAELPSMKIGRGSPIAPTTAYYGTSTTHTSVLKTDVAPEIKDLAAALRYDPDLIYAYVKNKIEITPLFGLQKGALGTYIDGYGTAFDQAQLMLDLAKASIGQTGSKITAANIVIGTLDLTGQEFTDWFGISDYTLASNLLAYGGIPATVTGSGSSITSVSMMHAWVQLTVDSNVYTYDPAYKRHHQYTGLNISAASGYSRTQLTSAAGTTSGTSSSTDTSGNPVSVPYVQGVSSANIQTKLQSYATSLLTELKTNYTDKSLDEIIGGSVILDEKKPQGGWQPTGTHSASITASDVPDQFRTTFRVCTHRDGATQCDGSDTDIFGSNDTINATFYVDEIYGRKLEIVPDLRQAVLRSPDPATFNAYLKLDEQIISVAGLDTVHTDPGSSSCFGCGASPAGRMGWTLELDVNHPYADAGGTYMDTSITTQVDVLTTVNIVNGWGDTGSSMLAKWNKEYGNDKVVGAFTGVACAAESACNPFSVSQQDNTKAKLGLAWLEQFSKMSRILGDITGGRVLMHHTVGVVFAETQVGNNCDNAAPIENCHFSPSDQSLRMDISTALSAPETTDAKSNALVQTVAAAGSTLEGSVFEQQQDAVDVSSTSERFDWASSNISGVKYYSFTPGDDSAVIKSLVLKQGIDTVTCVGQVVNTDAQYGSARINDYLAGYNEVIAVNDEFLGPGYECGNTDTTRGGSQYKYTNPSLQRGAAFIAIKTDTSGNITDIAHVVTTRLGTYKGGSGAIENDHQQKFDPAKAADILKDEFKDKSVVHGVDLSSGNASWSSGTVLSVGQGGFPYELALTLKAQNGELPPAGNEVSSRHWVYGDIFHRFMEGNMRSDATMSGSGMEAMGASHAWNAAGSIMALYAAYDVASSSSSLDTLVLMPFITKWWSNQLENNVVSVSSPNGGYQFVKLVDGTYNAPVGSRASLAVTGSRFAERQVYGVVPSQTRNWNYGNVSLTVTAPDGSTMLYSPVSYMTNAEETITGYKHVLKQYKTPKGFAATFTYDIGNFNHGVRLSKVQNDFGRSLNWVYDATYQYQVASVNDGQGHSVSFADVGGRKGFSTADGFYGFETATAATNARPHPGFQLGAVYLPNDATNAALQYSYNASWQVSTVKDAEAVQGARNPYSFYIASGFRGERVDPLGDSYSAWYGMHDIKSYTWSTKVVPVASYGEFVDELGHTVRTDFDAWGRVLGRIYPEGNTAEFEYDDYSNVLSMTKRAKLGSGASPDHYTAYATYNSRNKPLTVTDFLGNITDLTYDATGTLVTQAQQPQVFDAVSQTTKRPTFTYAYNSVGQLIRATDAAGMVTVNDYDTSGNMTAMVTDCSDTAATTTASCTSAGHLNLKSSFGYDAVGNKTSVDGPRTDVTDVTTTAYDSMRRPTKVTDPFGSYVITTYDALGRETYKRSYKSDGTFLQGSRKTYTVTGKVYKAYSPECFGADGSFSSALTDCAITTTDYDDLDRADVVTDGQGRKVKTFYNADSTVWKVFRAWATTDQIVYQRYSYTANGKPKEVWDANGNKTLYTYDGFDRLSGTNFPVKETAGSGNTSATDYEANRYDANGNVTVHRNRGDRWQVNTYDAVNRVTQKDVRMGNPAGPIENTVTYSYDLMGRDVSISQTGGATSDSIAVPAWTLGYSYDTAGRQTEEVQGGHHVVVGHDAAGNRNALTYENDASNAGAVTVGFTYDALNRMTDVTGGAYTYAHYDYDDLSRRTQMTQWYQTSTPANHAATASYDYWSDNALKTLGYSFLNGTPDTNIQYGFTYNKVNQITGTSVSNDLYLFLPADNEDVSYTPNGLNQYADVSGQPLTNNGYGSLADTGTWYYRYDSENRLVQAHNRDTGLDVIYAYDPKGRRISKSVASSQGATPVVTNYVYEGEEPIADYDSLGNLLRRYVNGANIDERLAYGEYSNGQLTNFLLYQRDYQGTIISMTNGDGSQAARYSYDAYGVPDKPEDGQPFRYTGRRYDPETGLYYYRARYYSAKLGRFLQTDPIGYEDNMNMYAYTNNDPVNKTDPTGKDEFKLEGEVALGTGGGFKLGGSIAFDTKTFELRGSVSVGAGAVGGVAIKAAVSSSKSSTEPAKNSAAISTSTTAQVTAGAGIVPTLEGSVQELKVGTEKGLEGPSVSGETHFGVGIALEAGVTQDVKVEATTSVVKTILGKVGIKPEVQKKEPDNVRKNDRS